MRTRTSNKVEHKFVTCFPHALKWRQLWNTAAVLPNVSNELNESSHLHQDFWISSLTMRLIPGEIRSNSRRKECVIQSNSSENFQWFFFPKLSYCSKFIKKHFFLGFDSSLPDSQCFFSSAIHNAQKEFENKNAEDSLRRSNVRLFIKSLLVATDPIVVASVLNYFIISQ